MVMMKINKTNEIPVYFSYETISSNNNNRISLYIHRNIPTCEYFHKIILNNRCNSFCKNVKILIELYIFFYS